jgi:hypothetical protein
MLPKKETTIIVVWLRIYTTYPFGTTNWSWIKYQMFMQFLLVIVHAAPRRKKDKKNHINNLKFVKSN